MNRVWYTSTELTDRQRELTELLKVGSEAFTCNKIEMKSVLIYAQNPKFEKI